MSKKIKNDFLEWNQVRRFLFLFLFLPSFSTLIAQKNAGVYLKASYSYNLADIPQYLPYHSYTAWNNPYYYHYQNNGLLNIEFSIGKNRWLYNVGLSLERTVLLSDTASGMAYCGNQNSALRFTIQEKGTYICIRNGIEFFPIAGFEFISIGYDVSLGYSPGASRFKEIIEGCDDPYTSGERKFFLGSAISLTGYIPIKDKINAVLNFRYQLRGNLIDFFTHVDYGFGIGIRYKISE